MIRKIIVSLICACIIAGTIFMAFATLYFIIPNKKSMSEIHLAEQVTDAADSTSADLSFSSSETAESSATQSNIYVADVYQSLTLRSAPDSNAEPLTEEGLLPLTRMEVQEFVPDSKFAYVKVLDGDSKDLYGYVNIEYIMPEGQPTVRAISSSNYE